MRWKYFWKKWSSIVTVVMLLLLLPMGQVIAIHIEPMESQREEINNEESTLQEFVTDSNFLPQGEASDALLEISEEAYEEYLNSYNEIRASLTPSSETISVEDKANEQEKDNSENTMNGSEGIDLPSARVVRSGQLGTIPWSLDNTGTLTLGSGIFDERNDVGGRYETIDYFNHFAHRDLIQRIVITGRIELRGRMQGRHNHLESGNASGQGLFSNMSNLRTIEGIHHLDTTNVTDMSTMFWNLSSLVELDLSSFNTTNVELMGYMFAGMSTITRLDLSSFNTVNVTDLRSMFLGMSNLVDLDISSFNTENVRNMDGMFSSVSKLKELDLSHFDTRNVTTMIGMFNGTRDLTNLNISNFDTSNVTNMVLMFADASSLTTLDLSHFDTRNVSVMTGMFDGATSLTELNIQNFNMSGLTQSLMLLFRGAPLRKLVLGENAQFFGMTFLAELPSTATHRPTWRNVGSGTPEKPKGSFSLTSEELMTMYSGNGIADTWVWQPRVFSPFTIDVEGQGTVNPNTTLTVESDEIIDISATPALGWRFSHWRMDSGEGDIDDVNRATTTFEMGEEEVRLTAVFTDLTAMMSVRVPMAAVFNTTASSNHRTIVSPEYRIYNDSSFGILVDVVTAKNLKEMAIIDELNVSASGNENTLIAQGAVKEENDFQLFPLLTQDSNTFEFTGTASELPEDKVQITPSFDMVLRFIPDP
ncbi:BspA family leucine-rich repeat surface protein [Enterococcus mundtii]|uniref:Bacterial repeat domain-containing protein n=1 Tax=Enterococcus mundtii TaxID=53346 RepID=A0A242KY92_ENTMU|nr:BspA family leucine-rich repeat surface protein [Enterococcus mundtii]OTP26332.1 hypothetical protein A5802_000043 [Enterococcus mundtii]